MRNLLLLGVTILVAACAAQSVPPHIQQKVDAIPADQLPKYPMVTRHGCRTGTHEENEACKEKARREYLANELARDERNAL